VGASSELGFWSFLVMLVPTGLAVITFTTSANSATQLATWADMRGWVMGLYLLVFLGGAPAAGARRSGGTSGPPSCTGWQPDLPLTFIKLTRLNLVRNVP
jgi:hypothetical protein